MPTLTISDLDETLHERLRRRADERGRSMEGEAREILAKTLAPEPLTGAEFLTAIRECFRESGGLEENGFVLPDRLSPRDPPDFPE